MNTDLVPVDGGCDCHVHIYDHGHALAPTATFKPPHAPAEAYRTVQQALGLSRMVVVQPTGYGTNNACTLDAVASLGAGARGVAVVPPDVSDEALRALHDGGIRGVRFMMLGGGLLPWSALEPLAARIAPIGWHVNLQLDGRELPLHEGVLSRLPCRLVIDHTAKFLEPVGIDHPAFAALQRLLDRARCWIKISAPYETSRTGGPAYADVAMLAAELARTHPERCLWASNWPHPNVRPEPSDGAMLQWALEQAGTDTTRRRMLVDNPAELYGFRPGETCT
jgi:D-galactarolactone isomerase